MVSAVSYQIKRAYAATGHGYDDSPQCTGCSQCSEWRSYWSDHYDKWLEPL